MTPTSRTALVVGATGALGTAACRELAADGWRTRGLVRARSDPAAVTGLERLGVEPLVGDLKDPASIAPAIEGASIVVSTASATIPDHRGEADTIESVDRAGTLALIDLVEKAGAERFLYVSSTSRDDSPATRAKRAVEERLASGRLPFTILRACRFMEIWFSPALGFDPGAGRARIFGSGRAAVSWVSREDIARFVALCASDSAAEGETIELGGPEPLGQREAVGVFEEVTGRRFELEEVGTDRLEAERRSAPDPLLESYAAFMIDTAAGNAVEMSDTLRRYPVDLTSVREFATGLHRTRSGER